ncbi:MAG: hypothetical protein O3A00_20130 [Planctomycetota bacterium]|nr:hypothetical protein [Planctomycetota bacterium]
MWQIVSKLVLGVVYLSIIAEGFRMLVPVLGRNLYRLPMLGWMEDFEGTYELDMASVMAMFMLVAVCSLWDRILTLWVAEKIGFDHRIREQNNRDSFVLLLGVVVLASDLVLFFVAINEITWSGSGLSITSLFATTAYVAVLVFSIFIAITLREKIAHLKTEPKYEDELQDL